MTKRLIKYFLFLSISLLIGYGQLFAEANKNITVLSLAQQKVEYESCEHVDEQVIIPFNTDYVHSSFTFDTYKIQGVDIEIEEDEVSNSKKQLDFVNYFSNCLYKNKNSDLRVNIRRSTFFSNKLFDFSFNKLFLIFNVFRI